MKILINFDKIMEIKKIKISDLKPAPYNPRKATKKQEENLKKSLEKFGVVEPIIFNVRTGYIVGGHFRARELKKLGYDEVDCVVVDLSEEDEKELNIRLNANTGDWDFDLLEDWNKDKLAEWGLELQDSKEIDEKDLFDVEIPFYEPSEIKPNIEELADLTKTKDLIEKINLLNLDEQLKEILKIRASFFTDFNFDKIADFYCKESKEVQGIMKNLGLVILAPKEALKQGFVEISENIFDL